MAALSMAVRKIESELEALKAFCASESDEVCAHALRKALRDKVNVIAAKAAALVAEKKLQALVPDLCYTFEQLLIEPVKTDPKCRAKEAIAKALKDLGHAESAIFLKGVQHVQWEPVWGGQEDTASTLRAGCALALLQCTDLTREDKLWHIVRLLTESSASARKDAALALESLEGREAALLLRIKARMGDKDTTVTGQVFESLLRVEGDTAIPFIVEFFRAPDAEVREEAALALGASRLPNAVAALKDAFVQTDFRMDREVLFRALSISRHNDAMEFLLQCVRKSRLADAVAAVEALQLYSTSSEVRSQLAEAVQGRSEPEIQHAVERLRPKA